MAEQGTSENHGDSSTGSDKSYLTWDDELSPVEIDTVHYGELKINESSVSDGSSSMYSSSKVSSRTLVCTKTSASPSEDDIMQKINVSKIIGDDDADTGDVTIDMVIPTNKVGLVIGKGGKNIKALQEKSGARMQVIQHSNTYDEYEKTLRIMGPADLVQHARQLVYELIARNQDNCHDHNQASSNSRNRPSTSPSRFKTIRYPVPKLAVGLIIGRGGETIKKIRGETGAKVQFEPVNENLRDMDEQPAIVSGKSDQIRHACDLIEDLVSTALRGYEKRENGTRERPRECSRRSRGHKSQTCDDVDFFDHDSQSTKYTERRLPVPASKVKLILGRGRETIRAISIQSGAYCDIERDAPVDGPDRIILLKGFPHQIELATELILDKLYGKRFQEQCRDYPSSNKNEKAEVASTHRNQEWGQGDPSAPRSCPHFSGAHTPQVDEENRNVRSSYSQWLEYFQPERQQAQADAWDQQVKAEQDGSPKYTAQTKTNATRTVANFESPKISPSKSQETEMKNSSIQSWPNVEIEKDENLQDGKNIPDDSDTGMKNNVLPQNNESKKNSDSMNCDHPGFQPGQAQNIPLSGYPQPGFPNVMAYTTRVVTLYYDINQNSVVVLNQWQ